MGIRKWLNMEVEPVAKRFPPPVFVVGCMRSGTTFLVDKLTQHPQLLKVGSELRHVWTQIGGAPCEDAECLYRDKKDFSVIAASNMTHYFSNYIWNSKKPQRALMRAKNKIQLNLGSVFYDWDNIIPVNKSTHLMNKIGYVHSLFPQSKFILIVRTIEGFSASMKKFIEVQHQRSGDVYYLPQDEKSCWGILGMDFDRSQILAENIFPGNFSLIPEIWIRLNFLAFKALEEIPKENVIIINYEKLVKEQDKGFESLFRRIGLKEEHRKKEIKIAREKVPVFNTSTKGNPLEKWKRDLSNEELDSIEKVKNKHFTRHQYILDSLDRFSII